MNNCKNCGKLISEWEHYCDTRCQSISFLTSAVNDKNETIRKRNLMIKQGRKEKEQWENNCNLAYKEIDRLRKENEGLTACNKQK